MTNAVNLNPHHGHAGRHPTRQFLDSLSGHDDPGKFGRMFPRLPALEVPDAELGQLAEAMRDNNAAAQDNAGIPAGFTYLGQFVDHDLSRSRTSGRPASIWTRFTGWARTAARICMRVMRRRVRRPRNS
jgi:hypothetical protein